MQRRAIGKNKKTWPECCDFLQSAAEHEIYSVVNYS